MEDIFALEIISPEKIIFSEDVKMVTLPSYDGSVTILVSPEKIIFSGLIISSLNLFSIKQLHPLPFFLLFQLPLQLYPPYKKPLRVNDHILPYI